MSLQILSDWSIQTCNEKLLEYRQKNIRASEEIVLIAKRILQLNSSFTKISDKHASLEQCVIAALDYGDMQLAKTLFIKVEYDFPRSKNTRAQKLWLMFHEEENMNDVLDEREKLIDKNPTDQVSRKRNVSTLISDGDISGAIALLVEHLEIFQTDEDSWMCLSDLYIDQGMYKHAAFCIEEIIMKTPHTAHYHIRVAEIYYTLASLENGSMPQVQILENFNSAKFHYAHAIRLTIKAPEPNLRALFGWMQSSKAVNSLRSSKNDSEQIATENQMLGFMRVQLEKHEVAANSNTKDYLDGLSLEGMKI